ncbi:uncharacterized protein LOC143023941 [Oratosquilla oratoria]|uniref:uncharacterized protein LOC143023941 n=1 Tax=Oratosquilla oratoria TaxID=337810 RepID=UPI003F77037C
MDFRKGRGCTDAIFTLRQLREKTIQHNKELNLLFVDQEKVFDRINRNKLWQTHEEYSIRGQLFDNIRAIYTKSMSAVRTQNELSDWFDVSSGVRQGCVLSLIRLIIYIDKITKEANPIPEDPNETLFADNQSLVHEKEDQFQEYTDSLNRQCKKLDMKISISKIETMKVSRTPSNLKISIDGNPLKQVSEFKYLGSIFTEDGRLNREIETRVQKANSVSYHLDPLPKHPNIPIETKAKLTNSIFILTYHCQT